MAPTIKQRVAQIKCIQCKLLAEGVRRHKDLDSVLSKHSQHSAKKRKNLEDSEEDEEEGLGKAGLTKSAKKRKISDDEEDSEEDAAEGLGKAALTKAAKKILTCPPNQATEESHRWQGLFIEMAEGMPSNDKMDLGQEAKLNSAVVTRALKFGRLLRNVFPVVSREAYGEENDRPRIIGLVAGLVALIGKPEVVVQNGPVRYFVMKRVDGLDVLVETSPPGLAGRVKSEALEKSLEHGDSGSKKWKMDLLMFVEVEINGQKVWVPRDLVEAKGDDASALDLYQASSSGFKLQLNRLQNGQDIERLYLEVWGTQTYFYGIQDIFGYITVKNGIVTKESFDRYQAALNKRKGLKNFPMDSLSRCPQTLKEFQDAYDRKAQQFSSKFHCGLTSSYDQEDLPVGVVYFSNEPRLMPTGRLGRNVTFQENCAFVQAHLRILGSNAAVEGDDCNEKLLHNYKMFKQRVEQEGVDILIREIAKLPVPTMYKIVEQCTEQSFEVAGVLVEPFRPDDRAGERGQGDVVRNTASSSAVDDVWRNPPTKEEVVHWTTSEVANLLTLVCGNRYNRDALINSPMDGSLLMVMTEGDLNEWLATLKIALVDRLQVRKWFKELK